MMRIELPHAWVPRPYQRRLWRHLEQGGRRALALWHRRAGKDEVCLHWAAVSAVQRPGNYWHMLPEAAQARKAIWEAVNPHTGRRRIDEAFPPALRETVREHEMLIRLKNGATWQLAGSDNYDSLVGSPPVGVVFSEWALADPQAWAYIRPILAENGGWALFIATPRGRNHLYRFHQGARDDPAWFVETLTAADTGVFTPATLEQERRELVRELGAEEGEGRFRQEYFCSFDAAVTGSYYGSLIGRAEQDGRICGVPYEPRALVHTAWDLGVSDGTAIWMAQEVGRELRVLDYLENSGVGLDWYVAELRKRPYAWGEHILPHDAAARELGSGRTRVETLQGLGLGNLRVLPAQSVADGINAARLLIPRCWFDARRCERGLDALREYRRAWDEARKAFHDRPLHNWASHGADAWRYLALGLPAGEGAWSRPLNVNTGYVV